MNSPLCTGFESTVGMSRRGFLNSFCMSTVGLGQRTKIRVNKFRTDDSAGELPFLIHPNRTEHPVGNNDNHHRKPVLYCGCKLP